MWKEFLTEGYSYPHAIGSIFEPVVLVYTILLILLLAGLLIAAFKAKKWVRLLGHSVLAVTLFECMENTRLVCDAAQCFGPEDGQWAAFLAKGFYPVINVAILGLFVYMVSVVIRIALKPRI